MGGRHEVGVLLGLVVTGDFRNHSGLSSEDLSLFELSFLLFLSLRKAARLIFHRILLLLDFLIELLEGVDGLLSCISLVFQLIYRLLSSQLDKLDRVLRPLLHLTQMDIMLLKLRLELGEFCSDSRLRFLHHLAELLYHIAYAVQLIFSILPE